MHYISRFKNRLDTQNIEKTDNISNVSETITITIDPTNLKIELNVYVIAFYLLKYLIWAAAMIEDAFYHAPW